MIRFFVLIGLVGGLAAAYLTTLGVGENRQLPPETSLLEGFRAKGFVPESASLEEDHAAEDMEVFEVPEEDEAYLEVAEAAFEEMMGNMDMGNMNMGGGNSGATMNMGGGEGTGTTMNMAEGESSQPMNMGSGENAGSGTGTMNMAEGESTGTTMNMGSGESAGSGTQPMNMAEGGDAGMNMSPSNAAMMGEGGLLVTDDGSFDREITLDMSEWKFSEMQIDVKMGERIRFTVRNTGEIPHEFMFMSPPLMQAVNYRATRADWSLLEHEALFEQALVLPGGEFSFVLQVTEPGSWMFMCMLPYHMQMGMMGQMATEGMAMDM